MAQPAPKIAHVIPLHPLERKPGPAPANPRGPLLPTSRQGSGRLLLFLVGSAVLHGAVILLSPASRFEHRAEKPEILIVRLSEVPQVAERMTEPQPVAGREEPIPEKTPARPSRKRAAARAEARPSVAAPAPPVPVAVEPPRESSERDEPGTPAGVPGQVPAEQSAQTGGSAPVPTPPVFSAAYLKNPPPEYPAAARRRGQEGLVLLSVRVNKSGSPAEVRIAESSGSAVLDDAALGAVQRWTFVPARRGDRSVEAWVEVPVRFRLQ